MHAPITTGIPLLDDHFPGLQAQRAYFLHGGTGCGKTLLGLQFLAAGVARGEPGLLVTRERPSDVLAQARHFGCELDRPLAEDRIVILEFDADCNAHIQRHGWKACLDELHRHVESRGIRRAVFDPLQALIMPGFETVRLRADLRYFLDRLETWGWTTWLLARSETTRDHAALAHIGSEITAGTFEIEPATSTAPAALVARTMRTAMGPQRRVDFEMVAGRGMVAAAVLPDHAPRARPVVLVADDDPFIVRLLDKHLGSDYDVQGAGDGLEALTRTVRDRPDVLVLDIHLPRISGFDVCRSLRSCRIDVPILLVSGTAVDASDRLRGLLLGAHDYIVKPFHAREVAEKVRAATTFRSAKAAPTTTDLDVLLEAALQRTVPEARFLELLAQACDNAARYGAALGLVRCRWELATDEARSRVLNAVERITRPEDAVSLHGATEVRVLLHTEDRAGTTAYIEALRQALLTDHADPAPAYGIAVYEPNAPMWTPEEALARAGTVWLDLRDGTPRITGSCAPVESAVPEDV
jgi:CheY-like chemotaxis protein